MARWRRTNIAQILCRLERPPPAPIASVTHFTMVARPPNRAASHQSEREASMRPCRPRTPVPGGHDPVPPRRSVVPDPELCEYVRGEPFRVPLAGLGKLNDLQRDKLGCLILRTGRKLKLSDLVIGPLGPLLEGLSLSGEFVRDPLEVIHLVFLGVPQMRTGLLFHGM
jgi:hypothetical protein